MDVFTVGSTLITTIFCLKFSFRALVSGVRPILEKDTTVEAFKALPTVNKMLKAVEDFANKTDLKEIGKS